MTKKALVLFRQPHLVKASKHSEYYQRGTEKRNCPLCGRFMKDMKEPPDWFAIYCRTCAILVII